MRQNLQKQFFEVLLGKFSKKTDAVEEISGLLSVSRDAVYRRFRGDSVLTPEELQTLALNYRISIDELIFKETDKVFFSFNAFANPVAQFDDYLKGLSENMEIAFKMPNARVLYATAEIPMFFYCLFPELMCFKLYVWGKTVWNMPFLKDVKFSFELFSPQILNLIETINRGYLKLPSTELWCLNILDNTLNQIEFLLTNGDFATGHDALKLCERLIDLLHHTSKMAAYGKKFNKTVDPGDASVSFEFYHNELVFTNNTIFLKSDAVNVVFSTFDSPNFLVSSDPRLFSHAERWFQNVKNKSDYLTRVSEKNRNIYFNRLEKKVANTKRRLETFLIDL